MSAGVAGQGDFIRVREIVSSAPNAAYWHGMSPELQQKYFMTNWSEGRLRRNLEMLKAFGFNSIQVSFNPWSAYIIGRDPEEWRRRTIFQCKTARELGMSVSQFVWASAVCDTPPKAKGDEVRYDPLDWHKPQDRARTEAWYRFNAESAPYVDRVITHWVDPGGPVCKDCTLDTLVEMHNAVLAAFRAKSPKIRGILSTWFLQPGKLWPGYEGPGKLAANLKLDRDTDIALGLMNYGADGVNLDFAGELKAADLDAIAAAGRKAAVWGWYTADVEILPALHVHTDLLQNYFRSLPPQTRTALAWHSLDDNCHGLNMQNLYVAGKLMQDPSLGAGKCLEEFVRGFVGRDNAPAVAAALRAVEQVRTRSRRYDVKVQDPSDALHAGTKQERTLPPAWLQESAAAVDAALAGLKTLNLAPDLRPPWPVTMAPAEYLEELRAHLESIRQMLAFLKGVEEVKRMMARGASPEKLAAAVEALPKVVYDSAHTAGLEAFVYKQKLAALKKAAGGK